MNLKIRAFTFALKAHEGQKRKYTGEPYIVHPIEVAYIVNNVPGATKDMVAAALLHDTVEDTDVTIKEISKEFGYLVASYVDWLTDVSKPEDGNRATRRKLDREHTAKAPPEAKTIKLADLTDNSKSILEHDRKFAKIYLKEKLLLLDVLKEGNMELWKIANDIAVKGLEELNND